MPTLRIDLHVHSDASYDGSEPVELILEHAADIGLDGVVVTDHDVLHASKRAARLAPEYGLVGIPGVEVSTAHGHMLAIGVEEMPPRRAPLAETVAWIHDHGGVAVVPHPFQRSRHGIRRRHLEAACGRGDAGAPDTDATGDGAVDADERGGRAGTHDEHGGGGAGTHDEHGGGGAAVHDVDAVEVYNSWLFTGYKNRRARRFADEHGYPGVAGSDAHRVPYVGRAYTEVAVDAPRDRATAADVLTAIRRGETGVTGRRTPIPVSARHYALGAGRVSGYYAKVGAIRSAETALKGARALSSLKIP